MLCFLALSARASLLEKFRNSNPQRSQGAAQRCEMQASAQQNIQTVDDSVVDAKLCTASSETLQQLATPEAKYELSIRMSDAYTQSFDEERSIQLCSEAVRLRLSCLCVFVLSVAGERRASLCDCTMFVHSRSTR
jgi:hypothetical protein